MCKRLGLWILQVWSPILPFLSLLCPCYYLPLSSFSIITRAICATGRLSFSALFFRALWVSSVNTIVIGCFFMMLSLPGASPPGGGWFSLWTYTQSTRSHTEMRLPCPYHKEPQTHNACRCQSPCRLSQPAPVIQLFLSRLELSCLVPPCFWLHTISGWM